MRIPVKEVVSQERVFGTDRGTYIYWGDVVISVSPSGDYYHASTPNEPREVTDSAFYHAHTSLELGEDAAYHALTAALMINSSYGTKK